MMSTQLENLFIQIPNFIFWKDTNSVFLGCNKNFATVAGLNSPEEIIGKTDYDLAWGSTCADLYREGDEKVLDGIIIHNMVEPQIHANGTHTNILINKKPLLDQNQQKIGVIGSYMQLLDLKLHGKPIAGKNNISLTEKQAECLILIVKGLTAKQIAAELSSSIKTVIHRIEVLKNKLRCYSKSELIKKALTMDLIKTRIFN